MTDNLLALEARDQWLYVAHHWPQLQQALGGRSGQALTGMPAATSPDPATVIDLHVSDLLHEITSVVRYYARILEGEVPPEHGCGGACHASPQHHCGGHICATENPPTVDAKSCPTRRGPITTSRMPALLVEVAGRYGHFTADEDMSHGFTDDAHTLSERVRKTLNPTARPTYIGPCQVQNCEGELRLREDQEHARCPTCGTTTTIASQRDYLGQQFDQQLLTQAELVPALKILDVPVAFPTLRKWVERGKLPAYRWLIGPPTEEEASEPALYRLSDAKALAEQMRLRRRANEAAPHSRTQRNVA